jgi:hypothetical protein
MIRIWHIKTPRLSAFRACARFAAAAAHRACADSRDVIHMGGSLPEAGIYVKTTTNRRPPTSGVRGAKELSTRRTMLVGLLGWIGRWIAFLHALELAAIVLAVGRLPDAFPHLRNCFLPASELEEQLGQRVPVPMEIGA